MVANESFSKASCLQFSKLRAQRQDGHQCCHCMQEDQAKRFALPSGKGGKKEAKVEAWSCLDGLWEALRAGPRLRAQQPPVLAHALRALLAMWQVQPCTSRCLYYSLGPFSVLLLQSQ